MLTPVLVLLTALLAAAAGGGASAEARGTPALKVTRVVPPGMGMMNPNAATSQADMKAYWTPARMRAAKPADMLVDRATPRTSAIGDSSTGAPGAGGGAVPGAGVDTGRSSTLPGAVAPPQEPAHGTYPGPHTSWGWFGNYLRYPTSTIGRLFFVDDGLGYSCSASVTTGSSTFSDVVWTAGHCVHDGGGGTYHTNFQFCPSYDGGPHPSRGCYGYVFVAAHADWVNNGWWSRDFGIITTSPNNVANVTGSLGFAWNQARDQHWMDFGYPAEGSYNGVPMTGAKIWTTGAEMRYEDNPDAGPLNTNSIGTGQGRGSSGGPWTLRWNGGSQGAPWINSNNSYSYGGQFNIQIYGPYYDTATCAFWKFWTGYALAC